MVDTIVHGMGMKWDCKLGEDRQIASLLLSDLNLVHDFSLISEKDNLVVASSCVTSKPIGHRLLYVSENLSKSESASTNRKTMSTLIGQKLTNRCWQNKSRSP